MRGPTLRERALQTRRLLAGEGSGGVAMRLRRRAAARLAPSGSDRLPVSREDLRRAGEVLESGGRLPPPLPLRDGEPFTVAWLCVPPRAGAGGFTTLARLAVALEQAGQRCILYLIDRHGWALAQHERTIRAWWPSLQAEIRDAAAGIADAHAIVATSWETAYRALASPARGARLYLVQDHEASFYPAGSEALLAEATYRFGFHGVTAGRWLAEMLQRDYDMSADWFDFGCELERYAFDPSADRKAVCVYARPSTKRRAFELALCALELFAERHPETEIHLYGEPVRGLPFPAHVHGTLAPQQLNRLYNSCVAGLVLSATNVSLVPHEMLAAGCIPVVNDAPQNRTVLASPHVAYAPATPFALADALSRLTDRPPTDRRAAAAAAAAGVQGRSWDSAGERVLQIVRGAVNARAPASPHASIARAGALLS